MSALVLGALVFAAAPFAIALQGQDDCSADLVTIQGTVTAFLYCDDCEDDADDENVASAESTSEYKRQPHAFVIDDEVVVTYGPWWYWMYMEFNITDFIEVGDEVNVTGEYHESDDENEMPSLEAWHIGNETTGEELTIKEEGRPPWAGGPKALGIDPWPPINCDG